MIGGVPVLLRGKARTYGERGGWNRVSSWLSEAREAASCDMLLIGHLTHHQDFFPIFFHKNLTKLPKPMKKEQCFQIARIKNQFETGIPIAIPITPVSDHAADEEVRRPAAAE